jgi:hypothetical protein
MFTQFSVSFHGLYCVQILHRLSDERILHGKGIKHPLGFIYYFLH